MNRDDIDDRDIDREGAGPQPGPAPRAPTLSEVALGRHSIAIQHMTIAIQLAEAPPVEDDSPFRLYGSIRAHLTAALAMLDGKP